MYDACMMEISSNHINIHRQTIPSTNWIAYVQFVACDRLSLPGHYLFRMPLLSAFLATRMFFFLQAAKRSPGLNGSTFMFARSAARPISQLACLYWYPGLSVGTTLVTFAFAPLSTTLPLDSLGVSRIVLVSSPVVKSPTTISSDPSCISYASIPSLRLLAACSG